MAAAYLAVDNTNKRDAKKSVSESSVTVSSNMSNMSTNLRFENLSVDPKLQ
jgi:hypothetical protein